MADSSLKFVSLIRWLLPNGKAWVKKNEEGSTWTKLIKAMSKEFGRVYDRAIELGEECDPRTASETLEDWEEALDLPDRCIEDPDSLTIAERRSFILQKLQGRGGTRGLSYYEDQAAIFGYEIEVSNYSPFTAGSDAGDALTNDDWTFWFEVLAPSSAASTTIYFTAGGSSAGDPLAIYGENILECMIRKLKPAHTNPYFVYEG